MVAILYWGLNETIAISMRLIEKKVSVGRTRSSNVIGMRSASDMKNEA